MNKLRYWCYKILPLVYDDSLSYYEVLCKLREKINEMIEAIDDIPSVVKEYLETDEFKAYIAQLVDSLERGFVNVDNYGAVGDGTTDDYHTLDSYSLLSTQFADAYGIDLLPNIICYTEKEIRDNALSCDPDKLNEFFINLLKNIDFDTEEIKSAYSFFRNQNNKGILKKLESKLNDKVSTISKKFNAIYKFDDDCYEFSFSVESSSISLIITKNNEPLTLSYQSTGFRWFFNLYFNFLANNSLKAGDIVIMDEPATHLHVRGQTELRKFLKDFTVKTGITIIMATHSPFLIDMNHLDELRLVKNINGRSFIENDFAVIDPENPDTLLSVTNALTVETHILRHPKKQLIFVEGITDYNFYIKFSEILGEDYQNLCFLPVNGIGKNEKQQRAILTKIMELSEGRSPILLVDGDKAGEAIKKLNKANEDIQIISLKEIDESFVELEELFTDEDRIRLKIQKKNGTYAKSSSLSSMIKNYRSANDFSEVTKENFKKVLDYIIEQCN